MAGLTLITPAAAPPITTAEAKAWCGYEGADQDPLFAMLIAGAVSAIERHLGYSLAAQVWRADFDRFGDPLVLARGPVTSVDAVSYVDALGAVQPLDVAGYLVDLVNAPAQLLRASGYAWPALAKMPNAVRVTFTAGFAEGELPDWIRTALLALVCHRFENRTDPALPDSVIDALRGDRILGQML